MNLKTNFVISTLMITPIVGLTIWGISLLLILLSLVLIVDRQQMNSDINALTSENEHLSLQAKSLLRKNKQELPSFVELQQLAREASALNTLSGVKGVSIAVLLEQLELVLPKDTFLKSLDHYPKKGEILLTAVSGKSTLLTHFLQRLEKDKHFERVMLVRQSKNESQNNEVQFDLRLVLAP